MQKIDLLAAEVSRVIEKWEQSFVQGYMKNDENQTPLDVGNDDTWNTFLGELEDQGLTEYTQIVQTAYERRKG